MRTEHDTWNISSSVGSTALFVAAARALEAQKPDPVGVDSIAEVFCRAAGGEWADLVNGHAPDHALNTEFGTAFVNFQGVRTKYFDTYFRRAGDAGVRQVVVLAAGLDSRAYRLDWADNTVVYELDQPQILDFKREALAGRAPTAQRREIPVDLRDDWPQALRDHGFDTTAPSAWIAEGLLIYLPAVAQRELFTGIEILSAPRSQFAVEEAVPLDAAVFESMRDAERAEASEGAARRGPFFQLIYNEQYDSAATWFRDRGWRTNATALPDLLRAHGRDVNAAASQPGDMTNKISLVSGVKAG